MAIINFKHRNATGQPKKNWHYHYTYYYPWLRQHENIIGDYRTESGQRLYLTAKRLMIESKNVKRDLPLQKIKRLNVEFRRLTLPLITGAVVGSFSALAAFKGLLGYWTGVFLTLSGFILAYYGWSGSWQINVELVEKHTLRYFTDRRTPELDDFIGKANRQLAWFRAK